MTILNLIDEINEGTTSFLTVTFTDKLGSPVVPASATYRIDCVTSGIAIKGSTVITPMASAVTVTILAAENAIQNQANAFEIREITVIALCTTGEQITESAQYKVLNLAYKT